jgi:hypothetical protein
MNKKIIPGALFLAVGLGILIPMIMIMIREPTAERAAPFVLCILSGIIITIGIEKIITNDTK